MDDKPLVQWYLSRQLPSRSRQVHGNLDNTCPPRYQYTKRFMSELNLRKKLDGTYFNIEVYQV